MLSGKLASQSQEAARFYTQLPWQEPLSKFQVPLQMVVREGRQIVPTLGHKRTECSCGLGAHGSPDVYCMGALRLAAV